jgi:ATP-binding cassette, subfamily G (WHITE), member 2
MGTLTVRENLMFSANLRLPQIMRSAEREQKVESAIIDLGLQRCANTKVGPSTFHHPILKLGL